MGKGDRAGRFHFPLSMNNPSGPILWGTAPVPKWQSLVRLCLRMRNYRYPDFPSKRSFWMENPPRPQPHNAPSGRKETVGRGKRTGNRRGRTAAGPTHLNRRGRAAAGPRSCGATQTLNDIPLYAVPEAAQLQGRRTLNRQSRALRFFRRIPEIFHTFLKCSPHF